MPGVRSVILEEYFEGSLSPSFPVEVIVTFSEVDVGIFVVFFCSVFCCWVIMSIVLAWSPTISSITSALWKCFRFYNQSYTEQLYTFQKGVWLTLTLSDCHGVANLSMETYGSV